MNALAGLVAYMPSGERAQPSALHIAHGKNPKGGRPKGSLSKRTDEVLARIRQGGLTPLEYMIGVLLDPKADEERKDRMAAAAAPYVHPRLSVQQVQGPEGGPVQVEMTARVFLYLPHNARVVDAPALKLPPRRAAG